MLHQKNHILIMFKMYFSDNLGQIKFRNTITNTYMEFKVTETDSINHLQALLIIPHC